MLRVGGSPSRPVGLDDLVHAPPVDERARRHHHQRRGAALWDVACSLDRSVAALRGHILRAKQQGAQPGASEYGRCFWRHSPGWASGA
eukprot:scaffold48804_cov54-Phaeocystis_antarctica.AAC.3